MSGNEFTDAGGSANPVAVRPGNAGSSTVQLVGTQTLGSTSATNTVNAPLQTINAAGTPEGFVVAPFLTSHLALDVLAVLGFGALVVAVLLRAAGRHETIPVHDPRILESIHYHE